jgi:hypothetical protein
VDFKKYQHVERIGNSAVEGILEGLVYVFPKIDGTNASVWMEDGEICAGSRNRKLALDNDNAGFMSAITQDKDIRELLEANPNVKLFGEWLVPHTIKSYREDAWRKFYVFDVLEYTGGGVADPDEVHASYLPPCYKYLTYEEYAVLCERFAVNYIPCMARYDRPTKDQVVQCAEKNDYLMLPGKIGEGVVVKRYDFRNRFGHRNWAKVVRSAFHETHQKEGVGISPGAMVIERDIAIQYVTKTLVDKERAKITIDIENEESKGNRAKPIQPRLIGMVWHCILTEELATIVKKRKNPTIDFKLLQRYVIARIKEHAQDLFS